MNSLFIQRIMIDWRRISKDSYLRNIEALRDLKELELTHAVTFFVGEIKIYFFFFFFLY